MAIAYSCARTKHLHPFNARVHTRKRLEYVTQRIIVKAESTHARTHTERRAKTRAQTLTAHGRTRARARTHSRVQPPKSVLEAMQGTVESKVNVPSVLDLMDDIPLALEPSNH